ncbi:MAG: hypothetical protein KJ645_04770 [Planctomycetes bacterium]|nr:hypothetical protein [Planctomycetota bacterium]
MQGIDHSLPENGGGKYFPSFSHWAGQGLEGESTTWPWKILGWSWVGMQNAEPVQTWTWQTCLQKSRDFPYASTMTWPYPLNYALGVLSPTGAPSPLFTGTIPSSVGFVGGNSLLYPSSSGGFDETLNIVAAAEWTGTIASAQPFYGYQFSFLIPSASEAITVPSGYSVYQFVWENKGDAGQYLVFSGNENDASGTAGGNKGKSYSIGSLNGVDYYYFPNEGNGSHQEWAMCLFLEDAVAIPVNTPGVTNAANPFAPYHFDVGVATVTPDVSSGAISLQLMTLDYANPNTTRILLAGSPWNGPAEPYGMAKNRLPHAWDLYTWFFLSTLYTWMHDIQPGYPACDFGLTAGGHSIAIPLPPDPVFFSLELRFCSFSTQGRHPSASFMTTFF